MNTVLIYDTETQGLPLFDQPSEHPEQPHIVQLGAILVDLDTHRELASVDLIVRPDGWTIPEEVSKIHGITHELASDVGVPEPVAIDALLSMWRMADGLHRPRIAHNEPFDARIVRIAIKRHVDPRGGRYVDGTEVLLSDDWKAARAECTQRLSTPILKLPPTARMKAAGRHHHKSANLGEAFEYFTGSKLEGAHNAMVDVRACAAVYFAIKARADSLAIVA